jgi:hypothetical protein
MRGLLPLLAAVAISCGDLPEQEDSPARESPESPRESTVSPSPSSDEPPPDLMAIPSSVLDTCTAVAALRAACPTQVPRVDAEDHRSDAFRSGRAWVFFAEWSGPYPGLSARNAPPRFTHVNVITAPIEYELAFGWPQTVADIGTIPPERSEPLLLGSFAWGGKEGEVALAPSFPTGGIEGDHVIFRWTAAETAYSVSLDAWDSIPDTLDHLEAVVESIAG